MYKIWLLFFFLISCINLDAKKHELAICAITRNDAPYLKEWVDFHLDQGVERIYIYDNLSEDHPEQVLRDYIKKGVVEITKWNINHTTHQEWLDCQTGAYTDCAKKKKNSAKWCAFIDTDEFLFCPTGQKIPAFLKQFDKYEQIAVNWLIFGTSNVKKAQPGKLIQELLYRCETNQNIECKSIVRLNQARYCTNPHIFVTKNMKLLVNPNRQLMKPHQYNNATPCIDKLRIHHYMFRDLDFFHHTKLVRLMQQGRDTSAMVFFEKSVNAVRDDSILKCLPKKN